MRFPQSSRGVPINLRGRCPMVRHVVKRPVSTIVRHGGSPRKSESLPRNGQLCPDDRPNTGGRLSTDFEKFVLRSRAIGLLLQGDLAVGRSATRLYGALLLGQGGSGGHGVRHISAAPSSFSSRRSRRPRPRRAPAPAPRHTGKHGAPRRAAGDQPVRRPSPPHTGGSYPVHGVTGHQAVGGYQPSFGLMFWCLFLVIPLC